MKVIPVLSSEGRPMMPSHCARVRQLMRSGRAKCRWIKGIFHIQMLDRSEFEIQEVVVGVDPGSKFEGFSVVMKDKDLLNVMSNAVTWVSEKVSSRRDLRRARRFRKTPCRKPGMSNELTTVGRIPPSTRARWNAKLRIINIIRGLYPVSCFVVEDIKAQTRKGSRKYNRSFSPLEVGKTYFYNELEKLGRLELRQGYDTKELRDLYGLKKTSKKAQESFNSHCVDSWVLAKSVSGGVELPDPHSMRLLRLIPLNRQRRSLHKQIPHVGGTRSKFGGSRPVPGYKNGMTILHQGVMKYVSGGVDKKYLSLNDMESGKRVNKAISIAKITKLCYSSFRYYWV